MDTPTIIALINFGGLAFAIYQLLRQRRDTEHLAHVTSNLERELHRLNVELDQDIQRLYQARDAVSQRHKAAIYLVEFNRMRYEIQDQAPQFPPEQIFEKYAEYSASWAELRGLAFAIGDQKLLDLVNRGYEQSQSENRSLAATMTEIEMRGQSQKIHTRISELIAEATKRVEAQ